MHTTKFDESLSTREHLRKEKRNQIWLNNFAMAIIIILMFATMNQLFALVDLRMMKMSVSWTLQLGYLFWFFLLGGVLIGCVAIRPDDKLKKFLVSVWESILPR